MSLRSLSVLIQALALLTAATAQVNSHHEAPLPLRATHPTMELQQEGRITYLAQRITPPLRIALTHNGAYPQALNPPFAAKLIEEKPGYFLIFTDSFASNPGNIQGQCGASLTGERYLHVVYLGEQPRETASLLVESCLLNIVPAHAPHWDAPAKTLTIDFLSNAKGPLHVVYQVAPDGTVRETPAK